MASKPEQSPWLAMMQRFERAIGEPVESFVRSDTYFDLTTQFNRARSRLTRMSDEMSAEWLHFFNLPTASDVRQLREQLSRVEREVNRVAKALADLEEARQAPPPARGAAKPKPRRAASTGARKTRTRGPKKPTSSPAAEQPPPPTE